MYKGGTLSQGRKNEKNIIQKKTLEEYLLLRRARSGNTIEKKVKNLDVVNVFFSNFRCRKRFIFSIERGI